MRKKIVIGTRSSKLALWQADFVADCLRKEYPGLVVEKKLMTTKGDKILDAPLAKIGGKGLFTKELEQEMLEGGIDLAVHSLKDMPTEVPEGLVIGAITKRADPDLPEGAKVGTSSLRRKAQLLHARPDLKIQDLRGNVNTRLRKLEEENFDAIVLAVAGLTRLGFKDRIAEVMPREIMLPAVGQGALAIEARSEDRELLAMLDFLNDGDMAACARGERAFLAKVEGGCQVPVGVYGSVEEGELQLEAVIASLDGTRLYRDKLTGAKSEAEELGGELAEKLLAAGGLEIMQELGLLLDR